MIEPLLRQAPQYAYFQALRLLRLHARENGWDIAQLRTRPELSLAFPETDIAQIQWIENIVTGDDVQTQASDHENNIAASADAVRARGIKDQDSLVVDHTSSYLQITANFFGLYGVSSPLPTYYTEELINEEREDRSATRAFLDVLHQRLYPLLHQAWLKPRLQLRIWEEKESRALSYVQAFAGLPSVPGHVATAQEKADVLRYAGLFSQKPRSAMGLQTLLADAFSSMQVRVESCVAKWEPIASDQQLCLGMQAHELGTNTLLGQRVHERANTICIHMYELDAASYQQLLPGAPQHTRLQHLVRLYLGISLDVQVQLHPRRNTAQGVQLSTSMWSRLGFDTWLAPAPDVPVHASPFALAMQ